MQKAVRSVSIEGPGTAESECISVGIFFVACTSVLARWLDDVSTDVDGVLGILVFAVLFSSDDSMTPREPKFRTHCPELFQVKYACQNIYIYSTLQDVKGRPPDIEPESLLHAFPTCFVSWMKGW